MQNLKNGLLLQLVRRAAASCSAPVNAAMQEYLGCRTLDQLLSAFRKLSLKLGTPLTQVRTFTQIMASAFFCCSNLELASERKQGVTSTEHFPRIGADTRQRMPFRDLRLLMSAKVAMHLIKVNSYQF